MVESSTNSTELPPDTPESLQLRLKKRLIDLGSAGHAVGIGHVAQSLADARQRVRDSHRHLAEAAGFQVNEKEEDMNIHVGDQITQPPQSKAFSWGTAAITAGLLALGGVGGAGVTALLSKATPPPNQQTTTTIEKTEGFLIELMK